jgi:hypothetical protein
MDELVNKIIDLFKEKNIDKKQMPQYMVEIYDKINYMLWEKVNLAPILFYNLKDTVWYNLEHIPMGGEERGMSDLRFLGKKYPTFISACMEDLYVDEDNVPKLLEELLDISRKWSSDWVFVQLIAKSDEIWSSDEKNPTPIVIYEAGKEGPTKYGYKTGKNKSVILNSSGDNIHTSQLETVHCCIESKLGTYGKEPLIRGLLNNLIVSCQKATKSKKGLYFDFENYDYL